MLFVTSKQALVHGYYDVIFMKPIDNYIILLYTGEVFDYLVAHGRMKEKEARAKFRQVSHQYRSAHASVVIPLLCFLREDCMHQDQALSPTAEERGNNFLLDAALTSSGAAGAIRHLQ